MTSHSKLLAAIASVGLLAGAGCLSQPAGSGGGGTGGGADAAVGGGGPDADLGGNPPANAKDRFLDNVFATVDGKCTACHGALGISTLKFMVQGDGSATYDAMESYEEIVVGQFDKTVAPMIHAVTGPAKIADHAAVDYTPTELAAIESWMDAEIVARTTAGPGPGPAPDGGGGGGALTPGAISKALIQEWSGCMNLEEWEAENVAPLWADKGTGEGTCLKCHINGQSSFIATRDEARMFEVLTTNKYYMLGYFAADVLVPEPKMVINEPFLDRVGNGDFPYVEHPQFAINGPPLEALRRFYDLTMARKAAGLCDPPRITD